MPGEVMRSWFVPGDGIDRHVISADIQRYLGNDATVRPGDNSGQHGYWIKAYRNLTSAMMADLRADSQRWRQEQRQTGTREPYVGSRTYQTSSAAGVAQRRDNDSSSVDSYGVPPPRGGRREVDAMQIDPPAPTRGDPRYGQPQPARGYQQENGGYPPAGRDRYPDHGRQSYPQDQPMADPYRAPATAPYGGDPRYAPAGYPDQNPNVPPNYYVPVSSGYSNGPIMTSGGPDPRAYPSQPFGQPPQPMGRDSRDSRDNRDPRDPRDPRDSRDPRDPRYTSGQPGYDDVRYAYPSPAATVSSVAPGREPISSPQQPSGYGGGPNQYNDYGRPQPNAPMYGSNDAGYPPARDPNYGRDRNPAPPQGSDREREAIRRRRLH